MNGDEQADEIARLRLAIRRLAEQDATLSVSGGNVTVTMDATLTDEEREAIANGASSLESEAMRDGAQLGATAYMRQHAATLRGLLARIG